jgi:aryl-alcohol dehydrogenase-like predicted oxidoreductase
LEIVTKVGARRSPDGGWHPSLDPTDLKAQVHENLAHLKLDALDVVNLRLSVEAPARSRSPSRSPPWPSCGARG